MDYSIRNGIPSDLSGISELLPRLAEFEIPSYRVPEHLWHGDRDLIASWAGGDRSDVKVSVATRGDSLLGVAALSLRKELLSGEPSAHLEVLAVRANAEGEGVGSALMREAESVARRLGAKSISLNAFANNKRARLLYERHDYNGELIRYYKPLS